MSRQLSKNYPGVFRTLERYDLMLSYWLVGVCFILTFVTTYRTLPRWIKVAKKFQFVGKDLNKNGIPEVAEMGGVVVIAGLLLGVFYYVGLITFYFKQDSYLIFVLSILLTITITTLIGILDDILGWKKGIKQRYKFLLSIPAALPLMAVNVSNSTANIPFLGMVECGILYPLLIVPIGIIGASNGFNLLAGYNGLEAGLGIIILSTLGFIAIFQHQIWIAIIAFTMVCSLLAFLRYNWYLARIFPGDSLTYSVGALIGCVALLGNMERIALILFIPFFLDFIFLLCKGFGAEAFARVNDDGSLALPYNTIRDTTHLAIFVLKKIKKKVYEKDIVLAILGFESLLAILGIVWEYLIRR